MRTFDEMLAEAERRGPVPMALAPAHDPKAVAAAREAARRGIARPILFGTEAGLAGIEAEGLEVRTFPTPEAAVEGAMAGAAAGEVRGVLKGHVETAPFLKAALAHLREGRLLVHVTVLQIPGWDRFLLISDAGVVAQPTLEQKVEILRRAVEVAHRLGVERPRVAVVASTEGVHPQLPATLDAAALTQMNRRGQIRGCVVDGPLGFDLAVSPEAARIKGVGGEVAGRADVLLVPDVTAGNLMSKAIIHFGKARMAGVVVGARVPLGIVSRADTERAKLVTLGLMNLLA